MVPLRVTYTSGVWADFSGFGYQVPSRVWIGDPPFSILLQLIGVKEIVHGRLYIKLSDGAYKCIDSKIEPYRKTRPLELSDSEVVVLQHGQRNQQHTVSLLVRWHASKNFHHGQYKD